MQERQYLHLSGIGTIASGDLIKVDDEFMKVNLVGLGTTAVALLLDLVHLILLMLQEVWLDLLLLHIMMVLQREFT